MAEVEALIAAGRALPVLLDKECQVRAAPRPAHLIPPGTHGGAAPSCSTRRLWPRSCLVATCARP